MKLSSSLPKIFGLAAGLALAGGTALADSISPETYETTLNVGQSVTITKTVTVDAGVLTTGLVDVFFLADTTGSMSGQINAAKTNANTIISNLSGLGDVQFGVGEYKDTGDVFTYRTNTALTNDATSITTGINQWGASGGGDFPEANLIGLQRVAQETEWRDGSNRVVVMFGDAPGHVGRTDSKPDAFGNFLVSSEANAIGALNAEGITVHIGNTGGTGNTGMNSGSGAPSGQANRIAAETGGSVFTLSASGANIADLITEAVESTFATYSSVSLQAVGNMPGVGVTLSGPILGDFTREETRTFDFEVTFTGLVAGTYDFVINALVNGGVVAIELDTIHVLGDGGVSEVPLPAAGWLMLGGMGALLAARRRRRA